MSNSKQNTDKLTNKQEHNRESIDKTIEKEYDTFSKEDLEEPTEEFDNKELNESSVLVEKTGIPGDDELETVGKPYGTLGTVGKDGANQPKGRSTKDQIAKKGKKVDDEYIKLPDVEKEVEDEGK